MCSMRGAFLYEGKSDYAIALGRKINIRDILEEIKILQTCANSIDIGCSI